MNLSLLSTFALLAFAGRSPASAHSPSDNLGQGRSALRHRRRQYGGAYGGAYGSPNAGGAAMASSSSSEPSMPAPMMQPMGDSGAATMYSSGDMTAANPTATPCPMGASSMPSGSMSPGSMSPIAPPAAASNETGLVPGPGEVVVAPKKGDLRFVPFNIHVKPGENVSFVWGPGPHTVTQSSTLSICNATQQPGAFKSGMQDAGFRFSVPVKDQSTVYYFCGVPTHCEKGMFGLINGAVALHPNDSFGTFMDQWGAMNSANQELINITIQITASVPAAAKWGSSLSMSQIEPWAVDWAMQQTLYTRQFFAQNPHLLAADVNGTSASSSTSMAGGSMVSSPVSTSATSATQSASTSRGIPSAQLEPVHGALAALGATAAALLMTFA
ncbi:hypothetical protein JCM8202_005673 [Rhodotorula sphaerocarpa]